MSIEVALFISTLSDAAGAGEGSRKGTAPKGIGVCIRFLGHAVKNCMTVIQSDGALSYISISCMQYVSRPLVTGSFWYNRKS